ncbi:MAG: hypothetical protein ACLQO1_02570 [Steroidobacteraceae bacterium]
MPDKCACSGSPGYFSDAAALRAAVPSFENMPLMSQHVAVSASDPQKWLVVGTVSNCRWRAPYIVAGRRRYRAHPRRLEA